MMPPALVLAAALLLALVGSVEAASFFNITYICESQCPDCRRYTLNQMDEAIKELYPEYLDITSLPYGNAKRKQRSDGTWDLTCQHGSSECFGNLIQACATHFYPRVDEWWPFYHCLFQRMRPAEDAESCAQRAGMHNFPMIWKCAQGDLGQRLMLHIARETERWHHKQTPWVVVNGRSLTLSQLRGSLVRLLCDEYDGSDAPSVCQKQ